MQNIAIIGGGAAGMACAVQLARRGQRVTIFERGERLGRKLSATGNGQGNVTNTNMGEKHYFTDGIDKLSALLSRFDERATIAFLESMGGIFLPDSRGRVYPSGKQASAVTDLFRRELSSLGVEVIFNTQIEKMTYERGEFTLFWQDNRKKFKTVVLATGGKAAPNFGTDGSSYALAKSLGHTVTPLYPSLVQLKCSPEKVRGLKGIRVDGVVTLLRQGERIFQTRGDILFTDSGLSGDGIFRTSSHCREGDEVRLDLLPDVSEERLRSIVQSENDLLCVVNNGLGRVLIKQANGNADKICSLIKHFTLTVTGTLGFAYAQVTKGGVPLAEVDENLQSIKQKGLYFAGEILNVDGECGGYNLQWAFTSAFAVAEGICS